MLLLRTLHTESYSLQIEDTFQIYVNSNGWSVLQKNESNQYLMVVLREVLCILFPNGLNNIYN